MLTVESVIAIWEKETRVCINLASKVPVGGLDYRPSAGQRTTLELMRYLSYGPYNAARRILIGDWANGRPTAEVTAGMPASDFTARMEWQASAFARELRAASPADLANLDFTFTWGETYKRGEAIAMYPLRWLTGYRMQLFLYLKGAGNSQLGFADCWRAPVPAAA